MGYVKKTISKDEVLIKQAKISKLSFLDRYLAVVFYAICGIFAIVDAFVLDPVDIGGSSFMLSSLASMGAGALLIAVMIVVLIFKLYEAIARVTPEHRIPGTVVSRLFFMALPGIIFGFVFNAVFANDGLICGILNGVVDIIFAAIVLVCAILKYRSYKLVLTDNRLFGRKNVICTTSFDLNLSRVENIVVDFSFFGKIFNYATVKIITLAGPQDYVMRKSGVISSTDKLHEFRYVKASEEFKNLVMDFQAKVVQH